MLPGCYQAKCCQDVKRSYWGERNGIIFAVFICVFKEGCKYIGSSVENVCRTNNLNRQVVLRGKVVQARLAFIGVWKSERNLKETKQILRGIRHNGFCKIIFSCRESRRSVHCLKMRDHSLMKMRQNIFSLKNFLSENSIQFNYEPFEFSSSKGDGRRFED